MKWFIFFLSILFLQSCTSVSYVKTHNIKTTGITSLTTETYNITNNTKILQEKSEYLLTKKS